MALVSASPLFGQAQSLLNSSDLVKRTRDSFDFGWKFLKGDSTGAQRPDFRDAGWRDVDLPHDWSIEGPYSENEPSSGPGGYLPTGVGWYRKKFHLSETHRDKVILLEFDGVYQNSEVWINDSYLGLRPYGYIPFAYELTPHLNIGGENILAVRVDNSLQTNCRWYSGSGIYRHTWLLSTNQVRVAHWGTFVTYPRLSKESATIEIKTKIANSLKVSAKCSLTTAILDEDNNSIQATEKSQDIAANDEYEFVQQIVVDKPSLWSPANPYLYTVRSTVRESGRVVDEYDTPIGIREAVFDTDRGFLLNGEHIKLNGVCLHHDGGSVGAAVPERVWERRLDILREMGCNAIRTSHNPYAAEFMDLCDRMGFLVMAEAFDEWKVPKGQIRNGYSLHFNEWHERDLINFIHRDRNHPSIVLWSAGNEIGDQSAPDGAETLRELLAIFHREDPTRPVTAGCDRIASDPPSNTARPEFLALLDIVGYNYVDRWRDRANKFYSIDREAFPQRRFIGTESSGMGSIRGDYRGLFPDGTAPANRRRFMFEGNVETNVEELWKFVRTYDYVAGDFMWTGIDYLGESFWPMKSSFSGVIDTCGFKKDGFYFYQSQWTEKPMLHLSPNWNWKGREGQVIPVTCYTNCDTVELFLNGKSLGVKGYEFPRLGMEGIYGNLPARAKALRTTSDLHLTWDVVYESGTLKAVATKDGKIASTVEVSTTGAPAAISLSVDRASLAADRRDAAHLTVEIHDDQGRVVPTADNEIAFEVTGEGKLIGVDNGDPLSHEDYKANHRRAFNGLCLAVVQAAGNAGNIKISASSPSLRSDNVTIKTAKA
ncbi:MAG: glycoside hydrolase family 2 TIM barrel-domain containing protein [Terracidiphilus sp.]